MLQSARTHPKLYDLCDRLQCKRPAAIGYLELLWGGTADYAPCGDIGRHPDGAIARWCEWEGDASEFVDALVKSRWVDADEDHRLVVHDWAAHCPNFVKAKVKKKGMEFVKPLKSTSEASAERSQEPPAESTAEATGEATQSQAKPSQAKLSPAPPSQAAFAESNAWTMAVAAASGFGLATARAKVERCRSSGVPVQQVEQAMDYWRDHSNEFDGAGALGMKLDAMVPGQRVSDGWPKRTRQPTNGVDVGAECDAVRKLGDDELNALAAEAFAGRAGLMANWKEQGRKSGQCIEHIARFRIRLRNGGV